MVLTGGITHWERLSSIDYPLPEALGIVLGRDNAWTRLFASIGLFGLVASFHGTIIGYSRQVYALARSGYLPGFLARVSSRFRTPHWALVAGGLVGGLALITGTTNQVIILSVLGAVVMYLISLLSLFALRKKEPGLERPFRAPFYPFFPLLALILSGVSLVAIIYYNPFLSLLFFAGLALMLGIYLGLGRHRRQSRDEALLEKAAS
jgi:ethanolamine permease